MQGNSEEDEANWVGYLGWQSGDPVEPSGYWRGARDRVLERAEIRAGDRVLDVGSGMGLLAFGAADRVRPSGLVIACDADWGVLELCREAARNASRPFRQVRPVRGDAYSLPLLSESVDVAVARGLLVHVVDKRRVLGEVFRVLKRGGRFVCHEPMARREKRLSELVDLRGLGGLGEDCVTAERAMWDDPQDSELNYDECTVAEELEEFGFVDVRAKLERLKKERHASEEYLHDLWYRQWVPGMKSMYERLMKHLDAERLDRCVEFINGQLRGREFVQELVAGVISGVRV